MRVRVRGWHGVASWLWVANDENCGICRMAFNGCCPDCPAALPHVPAGVEVQGVTGTRRFCGRRRETGPGTPAAGPLSASHRRPPLPLPAGHRRAVSPR
ncbi:anaphase-promoting complex subunit 11 isoform X1 [Calypte anna]|uniref:anaphase-promoting complex subunit 11 isoform X1 n=1 Tax=Calypte anna TaxID=9244 RepID=UPI0011C3809C|nr:anaphase-promoting complex subunit 11 isoform X1 [Calypte anna]